MSEYFSTLTWQRDTQKVSDNAFLAGEYSRGHLWTFDGGAKIKASSSPHIVPLPYSIEENVDPEEAFIASLSSCHMLFFLSIAVKHSLVVKEYVDNAVGVMEKNSEGKMAMTKVTLRPKVIFSTTKQINLTQLEKMHHQAHELCFIANSITAEVVTEIIT